MKYSDADLSPYEDTWPGWASFLWYVLPRIPWRDLLITTFLCVFSIGLLALLGAGFVYLYTSRCTLVP